MPRRRLLPVRDWPLSLKLATTVLVLAVIPLLLMAWINAHEVESQSIVRETQSLQRRAAAAARRLEQRALVVHGEGDETVPVDEGRALAKALRDEYDHPGPLAEQIRRGASDLLGATTPR